MENGTEHRLSPEAANFRNSMLSPLQVSK